MLALDWNTDGRDWPLREWSRFVTCGPLTWHVQQAGAGPTLLLIHGTGASTHSWRDLARVLTDRFSIVSVDLPGHGFTRGRPESGLTLPAMAGALTDLLRQEGIVPDIVGAHSAGAAVAARMALDGGHQAPIVAFGPALVPFPGMSAPLLSGLARLLFVNPLVPHIFARVARSDGQVAKFLERSTGSRIEPRGVELYARLFASADHCAGAIEMMADWDLAKLSLELPGLPVRMHIAHGDCDRAIRIAESRRAAARACAAFTTLHGLGHLAHEEQPNRAAALIASVANEGAC
jgi:magnesium chelatase accessory protein